MKRITFMLTGFLLAFSGYCQVKLAGIFGDHMVIQRSQPVPIWGWASPNEPITIKFNQQQKETTADKNGKWRINLDPEPAGGPYDLSVTGKSGIVLHDILIGEVWLCSGQSNMEFQLKSSGNADMETGSANYPEIRHIKIPLTGQYTQSGHYSGKMECMLSKNSGGIHRNRVFLRKGNGEALTRARWTHQFNMGWHHGGDLDQPGNVGKEC